MKTCGLCSRTYETVYCKECRNKYARNYYKTKYRETKLAKLKAYRSTEEGRFNNLNTHFKTKYGIGIKERDLMIKGQDNKCKICLREKKLELDHCHKTGKIRGMLCRRCNFVLGQVNDDSVLLAQLIKYLKDNEV